MLIYKMSYLIFCDSSEHVYISLINYYDNDNVISYLF